MKISFGVNVIDHHDMNGYGYATKEIQKSLTRLGYEWGINESADVEIWFNQPHHWKFSKNSYKVGYHPWESTLLIDGWADIMNKCDEIWTPSPLIAEWYRKYNGITVPIYIYEHGVDPIWTPVDRKVDGTFYFLHQGFEGIRKGGRDVMNAYRQEFSYTEPVEINLKLQSAGWAMGNGMLGNNFYNGTIPVKDLIQLYHDSHVYVYPSWGEGFGLTPLQAMATAMPTITVPDWAPYSRFLNPNLNLDSKMSYPPHGENAWLKCHPGQQFKPDFDSLRAAMREAYENYEVYEASAHTRVDEIMQHYNWDRLTKDMFENLENRLQNS